ncbi:LytTR family two component transcriptional regulator [Chitinophaga skermanii]|uniref:LytTR family two component transcriptional regulator n=1 Tax=Chitinophaga skermanii TaxID=331697 RepID=A0A327QW62_9BACT|nr:LytTR family DNA-binding domain-containing protein [Chitinophaga skermanii]RAJ08839.1 LytTR family two component transcriptional regulator [Chitinophaga skermanii]
MIKCLVADDEVIAHQILEQYILQTEGLTLVAKCKNAMEAFAKLEQHPIDLVFLDIEMPLVNGITFLKTLQNPPKVIFTTAYAEYALQGYELNVVDYLLKPFSLERFTVAVNKVKQQLQATVPTTSPTPSTDDHLLVKEKGGFIKIPYADIQFIEASKDYVKIMLPGNKHHLVHLTMKKLEETLPAAMFVRTHKSYIVGVPHIKMVKLQELIMANQAIIPISPNYKEQVLKAFSAK